MKSVRQIAVGRVREDMSKETQRRMTTGVGNIVIINFWVQGEGVHRAIVDNVRNNTMLVVTGHP